MSNPNPTGERFVMQDHLIFDTHADTFIGAGDACYLLNESNAALAAEREKREQSDRKWIVAAGKLREQLAAERELREKLTLSWTLSKSDNKQLREQLGNQVQHNDRLASENKQLREQLAAERKRADQQERFKWYANKQLATAVEALKGCRHALTCNPNVPVHPVTGDIDAALAKIGGK